MKRSRVLGSLDTLKDGLDTRDAFGPQGLAQSVVHALPVWASLEVPEQDLHHG
jgi:hypothetical protein